MVDIGWRRSREVVFFRVQLVNPTKAPKFSFDSIKISMVVGVSGAKVRVCDVIELLYSFNHLGGEREMGEPRMASFFILNIELR